MSRLEPNADKPDPSPTPTRARSEKPTTDPGGGCDVEHRARPQSRQPADRNQQVLTASVLLLTAASAVLLAIAIANR